MAYDAVDVENVINDLKEKYGSEWYWKTRESRNDKILRRLKNLKDQETRKAQKDAEKAEKKRAKKAKEVEQTPKRKRADGKKSRYDSDSNDGSVTSEDWPLPKSKKDKSSKKSKHH